MAKSTKTQSSQDESPDVTQTMVDAMAYWQSAGLGALNWFGASTIERMSDMGAEWMTFVAERVREDVALQHALLHAKSPTEVQQLQMDFLQKALDQYAAETGKMMALGSKLFETTDDPDDDVTS